MAEQRLCLGILVKCVLYGTNLFQKLVSAVLFHRQLEQRVTVYLRRYFRHVSSPISFSVLSTIVS